MVRLRSEPLEKARQKEGQVIDSDTDELALYLRIRQKYPMVGILIKQVKQELEEVWVMRSPRLEYD